jgi:hypothetical protein
MRESGTANVEMKPFRVHFMQTVGKGMRMLDMGERVDELEVGMNRAAGQATPEAKKIFVAAVQKMSFDDARKILAGSNTAATEYLQSLFLSQVREHLIYSGENGIDKRLSLSYFAVQS